MTVEFDQAVVPFLQETLGVVVATLSNTQNEETYTLFVTLIKFIYNISNIGFVRVDFLRKAL